MIMRKKEDDLEKGKKAGGRKKDMYGRLGTGGLIEDQLGNVYFQWSDKSGKNRPAPLSGDEAETATGGESDLGSDDEGHRLMSMA